MHKRGWFDGIFDIGRRHFCLDKAKPTGSLRIFREPVRLKPRRPLSARAVLAPSKDLTRR